MVASRCAWLARCGGELPPFAGARDVAAWTAIGTLAEGAIAASAAGRTTAVAAPPRPAAASRTIAAPAAAPAAGVAITARPRRHTIQHVVELAPCDRARRPALALEHPHQPDRAQVADDLERLEQACGALGGDRELGGDRFGEGVALQAFGGLGGANLGTAAQQDRRELGERLHDRRFIIHPRAKSSPAPKREASRPRATRYARPR